MDTWYKCDYHYCMARVRKDDRRVSGPMDAARIFAGRIARREYGVNGTVRTLNADAYAVDGSSMDYRAFIGRPVRGNRGETEGRDIFLTVFRIEDDIPSFKSLPVEGFVYVAERTRKRSSRLRWSVMPETTGADVAVRWQYVPFAVRQEARRFFGLSKSA